MGIQSIEMVQNTGLAWGPNKGHIVEPLAKRARQSEKKGKLGVKVKLARDVIREVSGFTPYERRTMELLAQGFDKRALKFCKKRARAAPFPGGNRKIPTLSCACAVWPRFL